MTDNAHSHARSNVQAARLVLRTKNGGLRMGVKVTPSGLMAIGGLVSSILLSTAVLVGVAVTAKQGKLRLK